MTKIHLLAFLLIMIFLFGVNFLLLHSQTKEDKSVTSNGAQINRDSSTIIMGTIGQVAIEKNLTSTLQKIAKIGFWYTYRAKPITDVIEIKREDPSIFTFKLIGENPVKNTTSVQCNLMIDTEMTVNLVDLKGKVWQTIADGYHSSGSYIFIVDAADLTSGMYFINMFVGQLEKSISIIVQK